MKLHRLFGGAARNFFVALALVVGLAGVLAAAPIFDFSNVQNSVFTFDGGTNSFSFTNGVGGVDFSVTSQNAQWPGSVLGYTGDLQGSWTVADFGNPASVSGVGSLTLAGNGSTLTGDLVWSTIGTLGVGGTVNVNGVLNLSNLVLTGNDANLMALKDLGGARIVVTFQEPVIGPPVQAQGEDCSGLLGQLRCGGTSTASYSGALVGEQVPEPSTMFLSGFALLGLAGMIRRRSKKA